ncbi:toll/interleukin-1 receptor domain-containing protein [Accumulibacter sp.]|nr:toll/interleukin-1 receptor domain-containing protein [Accumulibacter sp.]HRF05505.1 toll/interleukin-1 receptor domain-containing protein [Accumulibacter sp.]
MQSVAPDWLDPLREQLLPELHAAGLDLDLRSRLNIEAWIDAAHDRRLLSDDPRCAQGALRAMVSKSARDQQLFDQVFDAWRQRWEHGVELLGSTNAAEPSPAKPPSDQPGGASPLRLSLRFWLTLFLVFAVSGLAVDYAYKNWPTPQPQGQPQVVQAEKPPPAPETAIDVPTFTNIKSVAGQMEVQASPWLFGAHPAVYAALILALASAGLFVRRTRKAQIARITTGEHLREQQVFARQLLPVSGERRAALRVAARRLRKPRPTERRHLDIDASTRATASRGGVFTPVHRQTTAMPEYLLLVDRAGRNDQQAHWAAEMARDLAAEGVTLALYEFDRDPRWVAPLHTHHRMGLGAMQTFLPLAFLGARHAGQGLIVLGDGHSFIEPASGELHDWLPGALAPWPRRVLMTPRPPTSWGLAEDIIAGEGQPAHVDSFLVLPAQIEMLSAAARWFDERKVPEVDLLPGAPAQLPAMLEDDIGRWVGREAPATTELVALVEQLRSFLGPTAYTWLAASAAYPYLSADLTAYLAHQLSEAPPSAARSGAASSDARLLEARLVGIAQLPWCRLGLMPDWLRRALFLSLAPATRERVRAVLARLFRAAGQDDIALGVSLGAVASGGPAPTRRQAHSLLRSFARRIGLAGVVANEPPDSPLRDVIYLGVLRGDFDAELTLDAGEDFARAVRSETGPRLTRNPLRWLAVLVVAELYPVIWLKWWASGPLPRAVTGLGRGFVHAWRSAYADVEGFYAVIGKWFVRVGTRLFGAEPVAPPAEQHGAPPSEQSGALVYLSYRRNEAASAARALRERLVEKLGYASVWDDREVSVGASWQDEMQRALDRCKILVVLISSNPFADDSTWQVGEIAHALAAGKPIIPVLLDGATLPGSAALPPSIRQLNKYHAFPLHADRLDADLDRLTDAIVRSVGERTNAK